MNAPIGTCAAKDCDIVICDANDPALTENPTGKFKNERARKDAIVRVANASEDLYGTFAGERVRIMLLKLPINYNTRLTRAIGRCMIKYDPQREMMMPVKIELSGKLEIPDDYLHGLLVHEMCHAVRAVVSDDYLTEPGHGAPWKQLMVASGELPNATCGDPRMFKQTMQIREERTARREGRAARRISDPPPMLSRSDFRLGETVAFQGRVRGTRGEQRQIGVIIKKNEKTAGVMVVGVGKWRVPYAGLEKVT